MSDELKVAAETENTADKDEASSEPLVEVAQTEELKADGEPSDALAESSPAEKTDEESTETKESVESQIDDILSEEPDHKKDGVQRRIDKLTAEKKALQERLEKAEDKANESKPKEEPKYTEEQLKRAFNKAVTEGDSELAWEIQQYQFKQVKEEIKSDYLKEQNRIRESSSRIAQEWNGVVENYSYLAQEELYPRSTKELDINNQQSLLYKVALKLFSDPQLRDVYQIPGGQKLAVADALQQIIRKRKGNMASGSEAELLKRKLAKEKRKSSLGTGESLKDDAPPPMKPGSEKERLDDYINERKKFQADRVLGF